MSDTLVINADGQLVSYLPVSAVHWQEAVMYVYKEKCQVIEWYDNWVVRSVNWETKVPAVIMLKDYLKRRATPRYSKAGMYLRDLYTCQYCETKLIRANLTVDHVLPVSKGGTLEWNNCVTACMPCNTAKGDKQLMKPRVAPYTPTYFELAKKRMQMPLQVKHPSWETWLKV